MNWSLSELGWSVAGIAFFWGIISAVSLPLGAGAGVHFRPGKLPTSVLMAFGAGALLFALTIELFGHALHKSHDYGHGLVYATIIGAFAGGLLFDVLNQLLNNRGAFLRNISNSKNYLERRKLITARRLINRLSQNRLLRTLPPADIAMMVRYVRSEKVPEDTVIFEQGEPGGSLYFIREGEVELIRSEVANKNVSPPERGNDAVQEDILTEGSSQVQQKKSSVANKVSVTRLTTGDTFGVLSIVADQQRAATAKTVTQTKVYRIDKGDFEKILKSSSELQHAARSLAYLRADERCSGSRSRNLHRSISTNFASRSNTTGIMGACSGGLNRSVCDIITRR